MPRKGQAKFHISPKAPISIDINDKMTMQHVEFDFEMGIEKGDMLVFRVVDTVSIGFR